MASNYSCIQCKKINLSYNKLDYFYSKFCSYICYQNYKNDERSVYSSYLDNEYTDTYIEHAYSIEYADENKENNTIKPK